VQVKNTVVYSSNTAMGYYGDRHWALQDNYEPSFTCCTVIIRFIVVLFNCSLKDTASITPLVLALLEGVSCDLSEFSAVLRCIVSSHFIINFSCEHHISAWLENTPFLNLKSRIVDN